MFSVTRTEQWNLKTTQHENTFSLHFSWCCITRVLFMRQQTDRQPPSGKAGNTKGA